MNEELRQRLARAAARAVLDEFELEVVELDAVDEHVAIDDAAGAGDIERRAEWNTACGIGCGEAAAGRETGSKREC